MATKVTVLISACHLLGTEQTLLEKVENKPAQAVKNLLSSLKDKDERKPASTSQKIQQQNLNSTLSHNRRTPMWILILAMYASPYASSNVAS
ncbi:MAG TPA: hypothetical protein ACHBX0_13575, partial [Arsenophonus sp.]